LANREQRIKFGKFQAHKCDKIMLVKLNGEIFAKRCAPATFRSAKKFGEIDPWNAVK